MIYKRRILSISVFIISISGIHAQETVTTTGGNVSNSSGSLSYTIGQIVYNTNIASNGSEVQGVQQPYEVLVVTGLENNKVIKLECIVYPNPTNGYLRLSVKNYKTEDLTYQLYDNDGEKLTSKKIDANETNISFQDLIPAIYFLKIIENDKEVKVFKIIKNKRL